MGNRQLPMGNNKFATDTKTKMAVFNYKQTKIYLKAFEQAMDIFEISKSFPKEEKYSLTDQVRRSSRSVCANLAEAYRKKVYPAHFISKLTDCDAENSETSVWIDFAFACQYFREVDKNRLTERNEEIGRLLYHMMQNPDKY
jgi:four helix bundle protein